MNLSLIKKGNKGTANKLWNEGGYLFLPAKTWFVFVKVRELLEITNLFLRKFTHSWNRTYYKIFMLQKFGGIRYQP